MLSNKFLKKRNFELLISDVDTIHCSYYCKSHAGDLLVVTMRSEFLFAFHSNYGDIFYRLRDIVTYW